MKNKKVSIKIMIAIALIGISITLILSNLNNKNNTINKQSLIKEQLTQTVSDNAYVSMSDHLEEVNAITETVTKSTTAFIDTSNVLATVCSGGSLKEATYTATEDCIIAGYVRTWSNNSVGVKIDDIPIYAFGGADTAYGDCNSIYQPLKKGQTIKIIFNNTDNGTNNIKAYKILY